MGMRFQSPLRLAGLLLLLYLFFVSIALLSGSFKFFGKGFAEQLLLATSNPFTSLLIGILATSLIQSSSSTTSMAVALVASGAADIQGAIYIVMGANMGTSVTNTLVSLAQISRSEEFKRAFAAATMHDFFNLIAIVILFPLQLSTNILGRGAGMLTSSLQDLGGLTIANPLKIASAPVVDLVQNATGNSGLLMLLIAVAMLFVSLRYIVINLKALIIGKVEAFFNETLFKNALRALVVGLILTVMVQSSSVTTSLAVPLAGAGILTLRQIFPFTLGANVGTTVTALLASLVTGNSGAITTAFAHLLFNVFGIFFIWPIRGLPVWLAESLAALAIRNKAIPILYIILVFFALPLLLIFLTK